MSRAYIHLEEGSGSRGEGTLTGSRAVMGVLSREIEPQEASRRENQDLKNERSPEEGSDPRGGGWGHPEEGVRTSGCVSMSESGPRDP